MTGSRTGISPKLIGEAKSGDRDALARLVEAAYPLVKRWALVQTGDPSDADDLAQDVMIRMIRKLDTWTAESRFESWLYAMVRNAALDGFRKQKRKRRAAHDPRVWEALIPSSAPDPGLAVEAGELRIMLNTFFEELPNRQRELFDLVELQGFSAVEAAELTGVEPVTVRAHLFKARRRIRSRILEQEESGPEETSS